MRFRPWLTSLLVSVSVGLSAWGQDEFKPLVQDTRPWQISTDSGVTKLDAKLVAMKEGVLTFENAEGSKREVPLDRLAPEDRRTALIDRVGSGVVVVGAKDVYGESSAFGSGFLIHASGLVVTNYHVIAGAGEVEVTFRDDSQARSAAVMSIDREHDIAFLRVDGIPQGVHVVEILSNQLPALGTSVWTLGHPNGLTNTAGWGQISAVRRTNEMPAQLRQVLASPEESRWLQTTAVLAHGSSGGPLLSEDGKAVGINTFVLSPQLGFAVHITHARDAYLKAREGTPLALPVAPGENEDALAWLSKEVAVILKKYSEQYSELEKAAPTLGQDQTIARLSTLSAKYCDQLLVLAKDNPDSWPAVQALAYAAQLCQQQEGEETLGLVCDLALEHHLTEKHLHAIMKMIVMQPNETARGFCRQVLEKSPHQKVRVAANLGLVVNLLGWLNQPDSIDLGEISRRRDEVKSLTTQLEQSMANSDNEALKQEGGMLVTRLRQQLEAIKVGTPTPEIQGVDVEGENFKLSDYRGKVVLLDFFADWCPYCKQMYPSEREMVQRLSKRPFALLGVHCESQKVLQELVNNKTVTWRSWADGEQGPIATSWPVEGFPTLVLVDAQGIVRWQSGGTPDEKVLNELIEKLLLEAEG
ncbi:trypsin-like peptidase domain-containing protein [Stieleria sp. ICT_E10.1]|uniref:trypsin-like peptidase domain-containing protein n=1 Tax=Stieleria sedimenti TaxID=2976331 RepID=UPI00218036A6|nr:trypsin-like peptidase domain-containing protein [Stieleria sedimenti]MCS7470976.1 trypsin-like peptidase domain-containing protein [Stieleria sedimenti]